MDRMKPKRYWVIQRVVRSLIVTSPTSKARTILPLFGSVGVLFAYRTKADAVRANGGSRKDVACYWQTVD